MAESKSDIKEFLGKTITVTIDRPIGSMHPKYPDTFYPMNYGHTVGEGISVYILGVNEPLNEFIGKVIAVINRRNSGEYKLAVAPEGMVFNQAEIMEAVNFEEQYYDTDITGLYQKSCGAVIYRHINNNIEFLLLYQHNSGTWSCPKGHAVEFEDERQTALREIEEEAGLSVSLVDGFRETVKYPISNNCEKEVVLFLAEAADDILVQQSEIEKYIWADKQTAARLLYHKEYADIFEKAEQL